MNKPNIDANIIGIFSFRNWLNHPFQDFLNGVNWWGRQCRENGQKLHENDKISILGQSSGVGAVPPPGETLFLAEQVPILTAKL